MRYTQALRAVPEEPFLEAKGLFYSSFLAAGFTSAVDVEAPLSRGAVAIFLGDLRLEKKMLGSTLFENDKHQGGVKCYAMEH